MNHHLNGHSKSMVLSKLACLLFDNRVDQSIVRVLTEHRPRYNAPSKLARSSPPKLTRTLHGRASRLATNVLSLNDPSKLARCSFKGCLFVSTNMTEGARNPPAEPGRKAGTDRRITVVPPVTEGIPEGRTGRCSLCADSARRSLRGSPREVREGNEKAPRALCIARALPFF